MEISRVESVTDARRVNETALRIEQEIGPIDLALFSAGTYAPVDPASLEPEQFAKTMNVNYMGVVNGLAAVLPAMRKRKAGHVAWIARSGLGRTGDCMWRVSTAGAPSSPGLPVRPSGTAGQERKWSPWRGRSSSRVGARA